MDGEKRERWRVKQSRCFPFNAQSSRDPPDPSIHDVCRKALNREQPVASRPSSAPVSSSHSPGLSLSWGSPPNPSRLGEPTQGPQTQSSPGDRYSQSTEQTSSGFTDSSTHLLSIQVLSCRLSRLHRLCCRPLFAYLTL